MLPSRPFDRLDPGSARGQAEVTGVLLLIGLLTVSATLAGGAAMVHFLAVADDGGPTTDVRVDAVGSNVTITHAGGDSIESGTVEVIVSGDSGENRYALADAIERSGDGDRWFETGESAVFSHLFIGPVTVRVVDAEEQELLTDTTIQPTLVGDPANYSVTIDNTNSPIKVNQTLYVRPTIENLGDRTGLQTVQLTVPGYGVVDSREVRLGGGTAEQIQLAWQTDGDDDGTYTVTVSSVNDSDTAEVRVRPPAFFEVNITGTNSPVNESEVLHVDATFTNTGSAPDVQVIPLNISGIADPVDYVTLGLDPGDSIPVTMNWSTQNGDAGSYTATITTLDDSDSRSVSVGGADTPPFFDVTIDSTNSPVEAGGTITVDATIENTGDQAGTQTITLTVTGNGNPVDNSSTISLASGASKSVSLTWETANRDKNDSPLTATVSSENTTDSAQINVTKKNQGGGGGTVADANGPYSVEEGGQITLDGSGSVFQTGNTNYNWTIISGPGGIPNPNDENATYNAPDSVTTDTTVDIRLEVSESQGSDQDNTTITVTDTGPDISNFVATNPQANDVTLSFESDEQLATINATIDQGGSRVATVTESEFSTSNGSAPYTYSATRSFSENATYNATLNAAIDSDGNDGASGQQASVDTGSDTGDSPPVPDISSNIIDNSQCTEKGNGDCNANQPPQIVEFEVPWSVSDSNGDLTMVNVSLIDPDGVTVVTENLTYTDYSLATGPTTLSYVPSKKTWGSMYTIKLTATDAAGNSNFDTATEVADGN